MNIIKAIEALKEHPFTVIQLSDKEKFHTGMLSYTLNTYPKLFGTLFGLYSKEYIASVEENSIDLLIREKVDDGEGALKIIVESKFKTGLHKSKTPTKFNKQYGGFVSQLVKIQLNNPGLGGDHYSGYYLLSLFPEKLLDGIHTIRPNKLVSIQFTNTVLEEVDKINAKKDTLITLWVEYLKHLKVIVDYFFINEMNCINLENSICGKSLKALLSEIKLNGVFESYRYGLVQQEVKNELDETLTELLKKSSKEKSGIEQVGEVFNTHGNGGIHYAIGNKKKYFGVQWQGVLKLFIETNTKSKKAGLLNICKTLHIGSFSKSPSEGVFSSVTIENDWDIYGDIKDRPKKIVKYLESLISEEIIGIVENEK